MQITINFVHATEMEDDVVDLTLEAASHCPCSPCQSRPTISIQPNTTLNTQNVAAAAAAAVQVRRDNAGATSLPPVDCCRICRQHLRRLGHISEAELIALEAEFGYIKKPTKCEQRPGSRRSALTSSSSLPKPKNTAGGSMATGSNGYGKGSLASARPSLKDAVTENGVVSTAIQLGASRRQRKAGASGRFPRQQKLQFSLASNDKDVAAATTGTQTSIGSAVGAGNKFGSIFGAPITLLKQTTLGDVRLPRGVAAETFYGHASTSSMLSARNIAYSRSSYHSEFRSSDDHSSFVFNGGRRFVRQRGNLNLHVQSSLTALYSGASRRQFVPSPLALQSLAELYGGHSSSQCLRARAYLELSRMRAVSSISAMDASYALERQPIVAACWSGGDEPACALSTRNGFVSIFATESLEEHAAYACSLSKQASNDLWTKPVNDALEPIVQFPSQSSKIDMLCFSAVSPTHLFSCSGAQRDVVCYDLEHYSPEFSTHARRRDTPGLFRLQTLGASSGGGILSITSLGSKLAGSLSGFNVVGGARNGTVFIWDCRVSSRNSAVLRHDCRRLERQGTGSHMSVSGMQNMQNQAVMAACPSADGQLIWAGTENGLLHGFDVRKGSGTASVFTTNLPRMCEPQQSTAAAIAEVFKPPDLVTSNYGIRGLTQRSSVHPSYRMNEAYPGLAVSKQHNSRSISALCTDEHHPYRVGFQLGRSSEFGAGVVDVSVLATTGESHASLEFFSTTTIDPVMPAVADGTSLVAEVTTAYSEGGSSASTVVSFMRNGALCWGLPHTQVAWPSGSGSMVRMMPNRTRGQASAPKSARPFDVALAHPSAVVVAHPYLDLVIAGTDKGQVSIIKAV